VNKKVLFISHEASRSGAPILLLNLIKLLKENSSLHIEVLIKEDGSLTEEYRKIAKTTILYRKDKDVLQRVKRIFIRLFTKQFFGNFDLVISNTITNGDIDWLIKKYYHVFTYVHEFKEVIDAVTTKEELNKIKAHTSMFLSPSKAVTQNLITNLSIETNKIKWLPYYVPDLFSKKEKYRIEIRRQLGIPPHAFIIGGMGSLEKRKGTDLFFLVAKELIKTDGGLFFIWCGGNEMSFEWQQYQSAITENSLEKYFLLLPQSEHPISMMSCFDMFFLSSREDPYPLVMAESAMMQLPIVYFKNTGGVDEFVSDNGGFGVSAFDIKQVCQHIQTLKNNVDVRNEFGKTNREKYLRWHSKEPVLKIFKQLI